MKRVLLAITSTVIGLVGLLSFKSHSPATAALPTAALPATRSPGNQSPLAQPNTGTSSSAEASTPSTATAAAGRTYDGDAVQTRYGVVQVQVTVTGSKISNVAYLQLTSDDPRSAQINSQAGPLLLQETLSAQSANIDTISGATYTTQGYEQSLQSALDKAGLK